MTHMTCIPRDGIKEMTKMNNSIFNTHKIKISIVQPKGRVRNGMRIVQRSWDTYNHGHAPIFMPEWCAYASRDGYHRYTQCAQMSNDGKYALSGGRYPARYTRCLFQYGCMNMGANNVCPNAKGGVYKGYATAKIIRDCIMKLNNDMIDIADMVGQTRKIMTLYAESLTITLSNYDLSGRPWRAAIR